MQITDHVGDTPSSELLDEVLLLTKMNWNSARFAEQTPVTVRFAGQVGEILRDLPDDYTPEHRYALLHVGPRSGPRHQGQGEHRAIREVLLDQGAHVDGCENPPHVECGAIGGGRLTLAGTIAGLGQWLGWRWRG